MSINCPFFATGYIQSPELFIGRNYELTFLARRMTGLQPTSVNVYGERRIGKSSLLYHFYLTWENRIEPAERQRFAVAYASMELVKTEEEFYQELAKAWRSCTSLRKNTSWRNVWQPSDWTRHSFNEALKVCQETVKVLPVVCLDDVETILKRPQNFDDWFYDNLRAAMGKVMFIVASVAPLHTYKHSYQLTSPFFNQSQTLELKTFGPTEVDTLLLWADKAKFDPRQRQKMRHWGEQHPYLLQLAGKWLWEAQAAGKNEQFAKQRFEEEKNSIPGPRPRGFRKLFVWLGEFLDWLGELVDPVADWWENFHKKTYAILIIIAVILAVLSGLVMMVIKLGGYPFEFLTHIWNALFGGHSEGH